MSITRCGAVSGGEAPGVPWRSWAVGTRVVVRRRLGPEEEHLYTDVLGDVTRVDDDGVQVTTRRGPVDVPGDEIVLGKVVPPAPPRRPR
ncbi:hypothetical protein [Cellulomonas cellasea]|uniref:Histone acetyltransferase Rv0428c-like SH3 domain-containing protein n=1 Tax=Cellulomonas cellasea TaxID=43670 RepID=A0A7W4UGR1_9CELL|nr:hypothetical protein [Cellulomonas cellasea]MBB2923871.1 hypothetical protein [Cellulomonas cellasea]